MRCKYCGQEVKPVGSMLMSSYGKTCRASPTGNHVLISDGISCIYCGYETKPIGGLLMTKYGQRCTASPTGKHILQ